MQCTNMRLEMAENTHMYTEGGSVPDWGVECYSKLITGGHPALPFHN